MELNHGGKPRILLRTPTADLDLNQAVSGVAKDEEQGLMSEATRTATSVLACLSGNFPNLEPPARIFSVSSSSSLNSDEPSPLLTPARSPLTHQRSISLVDPSARPMVPMVDPNDDASRRPRGMSLPFGSPPPDQTKQRRRGMSFLHLNEGGLSALYYQLQHLPVPTLTISSPGGEMGGRKFSFGLRRLSQTVYICLPSHGRIWTFFLCFCNALKTFCRKMSWRVFRRKNISDEKKWRKIHDQPKNCGENSGFKKKVGKI